MDKGIITMSQAIGADLTPTEAEQLMALDTALEAANDDLDTEDITVSAWRKAFDAYYDALEEALEESAELAGERDELEAAEIDLEAFLDEQARLDFLLEDAEDRLADTLETSDDSLAALRDEQARLDFILEDTQDRMTDTQETTNK